MPTKVLADVPGLPRRLPPVALAADVTYGNGVSVRLLKITSYSGKGSGTGEFSGPALAVTVELSNDSGEPVSLDYVAVRLYRGPQSVPASPLHDGSTAPFSGRLEPHTSARAVYAFSVPLDQRSPVTLTVGTSPQAGTAVFSGELS